MRFYWTFVQAGYDVWPKIPNLWQIHGVVFQNDPELFIRPGGAAEALQKAKEQGKVRFVGFAGHKDPDVHLAMLNTGFPFDSVQMPLNPFDARTL